MIIYDSKAAKDTERSYLTPEIVRQRLQTLDAMALQPGEQVLDAGCGTGLLAEQMANSVGGTGRMVGVDCSADMLEMARHRCHDLTQVELVQGNVEQLGYESNRFDAASCIQTLLYVKQVETALQELHRVLKPHGRIAILETDWRGLVLNNQDESMTRKIADAWDSAVESPNLPTKLGSMLRRLNFSAIKVEAIPIINNSNSGNNFSAGMLKWFAKNAIRQAAITEQESKRWLAQIHELVEQDAFFFCVNRFLFTAVK
jgi:arsenite methyltransferase